MKTIDLSQYKDVFDASDIMIANIKECFYGINVREDCVYQQFFDPYEVWQYNKGQKIYRIPSKFSICEYSFYGGVLAEPETLLALPKFKKEQFVFEKGVFEKREFNYRLKIRGMSEILLENF